MSVVWSDEYAIGVPEIDEQHKKLFELAGDMLDLLKNDLIMDKYDEIVKLLDELQAYTKYHFEAEEAYMEKIGSRKLLIQKFSHKEFLDKIACVDLNQIDNAQNQYLMEILNFVLDWLVEHIMKEDKQITAPAE